MSQYAFELLAGLLPYSAATRRKVVPLPLLDEPQAVTRDPSSPSAATEAVAPMILGLKDLSS
ncbi:hypothetical protein GCM10010353_45140 [Streptomyces chryseus]|uniref:Uncharacterized protein n=1 Tax=Streptomyces chryseus TaxID=68186 RepID=A0ABQ3DNP4_9ACTN|nr:hypothetical protein GCM10010353_45140 [Streptomyces chryseus]GHB04879.1 hypothetical protein GCM10010346_29820 [Streptomyces chryseus]